MMSKITIIAMMALGVTIAVPQKCINEERFIKDNKPSWFGHCGERASSSSKDFTLSDKIQHYRNLADKIEKVSSHSLEYGNGDLEELRKWHHQFNFLPTIDQAKEEEDHHQHLQIFAATFQFLQKVQYRYHVQTFPQLFSALEQQALRVLCSIENNLDIDWTEKLINKEEMNQIMCRINLAGKNSENQNFRNARFTQMLFRQYLTALHEKIEGEAAKLEAN